MQGHIERQAQAAPLRDGVPILVVDDEPAFADAVAAALRLEGYTVSTAGGGREALDAVYDSAPALIVLDVCMPGIDGFEVTRRIRYRGLDTPILLLSSHADTEDTVFGLALGGDDFMTKPVNLAELVARVHSILRRTRLSQAADRGPRGRA